MRKEDGFSGGVVDKINHGVGSGSVQFTVAVLKPEDEHVECVEVFIEIGIMDGLVYAVFVFPRHVP